MSGATVATTLEAALEYARRGWPVLPLHGVTDGGRCTCGDPVCRSKGKHPRTEHGLKDAACDGQTILRWWEEWPDANVGIATGLVVVVDVDPRHGGDDSLAALEQVCGALPATLESRTGGGGRHLFLAPSDGQVIRNSAGKLGPGLDVRGEGGYVVVPPSLHSSGSRYEWANETDPAPSPEWLASRLSEPAPRAASPKDSVGKIPEGQRNSHLTSFAGTMRRRGMCTEAIVAALLEENRCRCEPLLPENEVRKIAASVGRYEPVPAPEADGDVVTNGKESASTKLVNLARRSVELFHSGDTCFATLATGEHRETHALNSRGFRRWLTKVFFERCGKATGGEAIKNAITTLEGFARFECEERDVFVRVAPHDGKIYLDLCDEGWRVVEVGNQSWRVIEPKECPVRFRRAHGMLALPTPEPGGTLDELRPFLNLASDDDFVLAVSWLIGAFHPSGPYPLLILHGEQGSAKSTAATVLKNLIDPNLAPRRTAPHEARDLMIAASNGFVCSFDNLSHLPDWLSDAFCRLSTGGGFGTRSLYTDDEEIIFEAKRPVILNGIEELATRGDLLNRAVPIDLPPIPDEKRRDEAEFGDAFKAAQPRLLGALLDAVSTALRTAESVKLPRLPRMADFAKWVTAAEPALGWARGTFLSVYEANRQAANELPLETPVAGALRKLTLPWSGTATELLPALGSLVDEQTRCLKGWPTSGRSLSNELRRLSPNLRQAGISIEFCREKSRARRREICITSESRGNPWSKPSEPPKSHTPADDGSDATHSPSSGVSGSSSGISDAADAADGTKHPLEDSSLTCPRCGNVEQNLTAAQYHYQRLCPERGRGMER